MKHFAQHWAYNCSLASCEITKSYNFEVNHGYQKSKDWVVCGSSLEYMSYFSIDILGNHKVTVPIFLVFRLHSSFWIQYLIKKKYSKLKFTMMFKFFSFIFHRLILRLTFVPWIGPFSFLYNNIIYSL